MKVVLFALNGSWSHTNLAIRCLRPPLEREGFEVTLVEYSLRDRTSHILEHLYRERAHIYGFSCYIWNLPQMLSLADSLHHLLPDCRILLGGPEVSYETGRFEHLPFVDGVISGEGEEAVPAVCRAIREGRSFDRVTYGGTPRVMEEEGILYREGDAMGTLLYYESSRGCPYSCAYCLSSATRGVRCKTVEQTLRDLRAFEELKQEIRVIKFVDRTFNFDVQRANRIWEALLEDSFTKCYHFEVCASLFNEESFEILRRFPKGKIQLEFGLQSTHPETLAAVSRHIQPQRVIETVRRIHSFGNIHVHLDLIAGLPFEGYQRFAKSFDDAYGSCDLLQLGFLKLLYGTALRQRAEEYGYVALTEPPYTVLQSRWMSYGEMLRLSHIAEAMERYLESGRFCRTLAAAIRQVTSPFAFWEGLCDYLAEQDPRPLQKISQPDAYRYLKDYLETVLLESRHGEMKRLLAEDFSEHEHKHPPYFLK